MSNFEVFSPPFAEMEETGWIRAGQSGVDITDPRGNELLVVKKLEAAK